MLKRTRNLLIPVVLIALSACASDVKSFDYGNVLLAAHKVSVYEVLGNSDWYDGEPVYMVGVADFAFGPERASGLYASTSDYRHATYAWIALELSDDTKGLRERFRALNGRYITVSGIYHSYGKKRIPTPEEQNDPNSTLITICLGLCGAAGYIDVRSISAEPLRFR